MTKVGTKYGKRFFLQHVLTDRCAVYICFEKGTCTVHSTVSQERATIPSPTFLNGVRQGEQWVMSPRTFESGWTQMC